MPKSKLFISFFKKILFYMKKIILIDVIDPRIDKKEAEKRMIESENLVDTFWWFVVVKKIQKKQLPNYKYFVWAWKLEEIRGIALAEWVDIIILNNHLKTQQLFNIEWDFFQNDDIQIWDRVDLILNIFKKHASSSEAKLQIELAAIKHMWPRIFWMWMELSKQWWWIWTRWKGETNTEIMKRHLAKQEKVLVEKIKKLEKRREWQRLSRERKWFKQVAIVWYTNAWKSQLMSAITKKNIKIKDELFATLDTRVWEMYLQNSWKTCLVSDTIWFIRDLPPDLIQAFKSTLEEAIYADLILHVVDFSDPEKEEKIQVTNEILADLWAENIPKILVFNKIDLVFSNKNFSNYYDICHSCEGWNPGWNTLEKEWFCFYIPEKYRKLNPVFVSALGKIRVLELKSEIEEFLEK